MEKCLQYEQKKNVTNLKKKNQAKNVLQHDLQKAGHSGTMMQHAGTMMQHVGTMLLHSGTMMQHAGTMIQYDAQLSERLASLGIMEG